VTAIETLKHMLNQKHLLIIEREAVREVLAMVEDCERDHPPEPWASELKADNERLRAALTKIAEAVLTVPAAREEAIKALRGESDE